MRGAAVSPNGSAPSASRAARDGPTPDCANRSKASARANGGLTAARHARNCLTGQGAHSVRVDDVTSGARLPERVSQESRGACSCGRRAGHRRHLHVGRWGRIGGVFRSRRGPRLALAAPSRRGATLSPSPDGRSTRPRSKGQPRQPGSCHVATAWQGGSRPRAPPSHSRAGHHLTFRTGSRRLRRPQSAAVARVAVTTAPLAAPSEGVLGARTPCGAMGALDGAAPMVATGGTATSWSGIAMERLPPESPRHVSVGRHGSRPRSRPVRPHGGAG